MCPTEPDSIMQLLNEVLVVIARAIGNCSQPQGEGDELVRIGVLQMIP